MRGGVVRFVRLRSGERSVESRIELRQTGACFKHQPLARRILRFQLLESEPTGLEQPALMLQVGLGNDIGSGDIPRQDVERGARGGKLHLLDVQQFWIGGERSVASRARLQQNLMQRKRGHRRSERKQHCKDSGAQARRWRLRCGHCVMQ